MRKELLQLKPTWAKKTSKAKVRCWWLPHSDRYHILVVQLSWCCSSHAIIWQQKQQPTFIISCSGWLQSSMLQWANPKDSNVTYPMESWQDPAEKLQQHTSNPTVWKTIMQGSCRVLVVAAAAVSHHWWFSCMWCLVLQAPSTGEAGNQLRAHCSLICTPITITLEVITWLLKPPVFFYGPLVLT